MIEPLTAHTAILTLKSPQLEPSEFFSCWSQVWTRNQPSDDVLGESEAIVATELHTEYGLTLLDAAFAEDANAIASTATRDNASPIRFIQPTFRNIGRVTVRALSEYTTFRQKNQGLAAKIASRTAIPHDFRP